MIPFLFILGCGPSDEPEATKSDTPKAESPKTNSEQESTNPPPTPNQSNPTSTENTQNKTDSPEIEQANQGVQNENIVKGTAKELIPSPDIEGMVKKEKKKKIRAEEIDEYVNKTENLPKITKSEEVVEVTVEENYNVHYNDLNSSIFVQIYKDSSSIAASMSHNHVIKARGWEGQVIWKPNEPHNCLLEFQIPVHFLEIDPDSLRKDLNMEGILSKKDKNEVRKNMLSTDQLWAEKFSHINFSAQNCTISDDHVLVTGQLKIKGVTKKIKTKLQFTSGEKLSISGTFFLNQTSFGITPYSAFMGAVKNKNKVKITLDLNQ